ncbi:hypothetical protein K493DRAFT_297546 [Basidiobolus meristosporus CBS 931.73]|uniref:Uncharacterized protein n=1 Tax=Basidiobolus meristosporus CBS 931.73 TaxID=1314790 RepID=A0A1Y1YZ45_9FUNG|nr:hypothetical protein K493DRAFT_297546 [Basidiobolus meristosporus CBS 931.73]|eukprot:ORY03291.1 hypothetical protein K493DRAFT_297546 [Basidiobolus meristosporus CBS 931.73]
MDELGSKNYDLEKKTSAPHQAYQLYRIEDIPDYSKDNPFIQIGYHAYYSYREAFGGRIGCSQETCGCISGNSSCIAGDFLPNEASLLDKEIFALLLLSAAQLPDVLIPAPLIYWVLQKGN